MAKSLRDCLPPFDEEAWRRADEKMKADRERRNALPPEPVNTEQEGIDAYLRGEDIEECPFTDANEVAAWENGWHEAESDDESGE